MDALSLIVIVLLLIQLGLAYLSMKFFKKFTAASKYGRLLNVLTFAISFVILFVITLTIIDNTVTFER